MVKQSVIWPLALRDRKIKIRDILSNKGPKYKNGLSSNSQEVKQAVDRYWTNSLEQTNQRTKSTVW